MSLLPASILYLSVSKQVELPSLRPVQGCSVPPYPIPSIRSAVSGIVNNKLTICGGEWVNIVTNNNNNYSQDMMVETLYPSVTPWTMASGGCSSQS